MSPGVPACVPVCVSSVCPCMSPVCVPVCVSSVCPCMCQHCVSLHVTVCPGMCPSMCQQHVSLHVTGVCPSFVPACVPACHQRVPACITSLLCSTSHTVSTPSSEVFFEFFGMPVLLWASGASNMFPLLGKYFSPVIQFVLIFQNA